MARFNNGLIYTNDKCIGCNKCVSQCSIMAANISVMVDGKAKIVIDGEKCNHCGKCIKLCRQGAREYIDDTDMLFAALQAGRKISLLVAPSFYMLYHDLAPKILGYLKSAGIEKIYDVAYGADICLWGHVNYLKKHMNDKDAAYITQTCPALINVIELYHPELISKVIPVQSPMMCTAIYAHKYLGDTNEMAFLGPCISKKDEISTLMTNRNINYSLTYKHLFDYLKDKDIENFYAESDLKSDGRGNFISLSGDFAKSIECFFPDSEKLIQKEGLTPYVFQMLKGFSKVENVGERPIAIDVLACQNGCQEGPGTDFEKLNLDKVYTQVNDNNRKCKNRYPKTVYPDENFRLLNETFKDLDINDFTRLFEQRYRQPYTIPEDVIEEIFENMLKDNDVKKNIDCGSCGYKTCREMASAIAYGYNRKENCIHYMNEFMIKRLNTDHLTGLVNRGMFNKLSIELLKENPDKTYVFAIGNINRIKVINDLYGPENGDLALVKVAETLNKLSERGGIVSRFGADNFAICIEDTMENFEALYSIPVWNLKEYGIDFPITMRFGVLIVNAKDGDVLSVLNLAAIAMDEKIRLTDNTFTVFTKEMHQKLKKEIEITAQLEPAMERDEFQLYYQPQYSAHTNALCGAEALCRWVKADGTVVSPTDFIPLSEKNGFIKILDEVIWEKAFKNIRTWIDRGLKIVPTSINISRVTISSDNLVYAIARLQDKYNIPAEYVHFEITESAYMNNQHDLINRVNRIRDMGFKVAMDDFGSGYSSLNTLKDIPIDILKLDMGFVRDNSNMERGGTIISSVARMVQALNLVTVAEGVETEDQAMFLKSIGVEILQGYLFSKPIPQKDYENKLMNEETTVIQLGRYVGNYDITSITDPTSNESMMFEFFSGPACIIEIDREELYLIRINKRASELLGIEDWNFSEIQKELQSVLKEDKSVLIQKTLNAMKNEEVFVNEIEFEHGETGRPVDLKYTAWGIGSTGENKYCIFVQLEDITRQKLYEKTLGLVNTQVKLLINQSVVGLILFRVTLNKKNILNPFGLKVLDMNEQFTALSGFSRDEVMKWTEKQAMEVIHPMDRPSVVATFAKATVFKHHKSVQCDYRGYTKDGSIKKVRIMASGLKNTEDSLIVVANFIVLDDDKNK
ncbi:MAG: EAL domain-containing protein [Treponema sp.]|uniref:EAL domain-containing protein n=1 Tax=Treponema sp. TaxID=166 RepID=UPI00298D8377|nr:EAL domain-containing protein [Treponema sp.]MBR5932464.1 EAL domain-containing protein [Treponema sp.]